MSVVGPSGREFRGCLKEWGIATDEPTKGCIDVGDFILMSAPNRYRKMGSSFEWTRECILAIQKEE